MLVCIRLNSLSGAYVFCWCSWLVVCLFGCLLFLFLIVWCLLVFFVGSVIELLVLCLGDEIGCSGDFPAGVCFGLLVCW